MNTEQSATTDERYFQFDSSAFKSNVQDTILEPYTSDLIAAVVARADDLKHGHLPGWRQAVNDAPELDDAQLTVKNGQVCITTDSMDDDQRSGLMISLQSLMPWRKGPFRFNDIVVDTEWRSDWKWDRLISHIQPLHNRRVLDVGCGSGYHLWRMREAGASLALGIDPGMLFIHQFALLQRYARDSKTLYLPSWRI